MSFHPFKCSSVNYDKVWHHTDAMTSIDTCQTAHANYTNYIYYIMTDNSSISHIDITLHHCPCMTLQNYYCVVCGWCGLCVCIHGV